MRSALLLTAVIACILHGVEPHGYMEDPPSRSSMWRPQLGGFKTPKNYDDNGLNCGGKYVQHSQNGGKCGICGDNYADAQPRPNEAGGKYGTGTITRFYKSGQTIPIKVFLTAHHKGWFEFRLCPNNNPNKVATPQCFNRYLLQRADGSSPRFNVPETYDGHFAEDFKLPAGLSCTQCIIQWRYVTGWDKTDPEEFRGCSDISISSGGGKDPCTGVNCAFEETCVVVGNKAKCVCEGSSCNSKTTTTTRTWKPVKTTTTRKPGKPGKPVVCPTIFAMFRNPSDCGSFYQCVWGNPVLQRCPAGLHFDNRHRVCNYAHAVGCTRG